MLSGTSSSALPSAIPCARCDRLRTGMWHDQSGRLPVRLSGPGARASVPCWPTRGSRGLLFPARLTALQRTPFVSPKSACANRGSPTSCRCDYRLINPPPRSILLWPGRSAEAAPRSIICLTISLALRVLHPTVQGLAPNAILCRGRVYTQVDPSLFSDNLAVAARKSRTWRWWPRCRSGSE